MCKTKLLAIVLAAMLTAALLSGCDSSSTTTNPNAESSQTPSSTAFSSGASASQPPGENDQFSPLETYKLLEENESAPYTLNEKAEAFLKEHPDFFPYQGKEADLSEYADTTLEAKHINKNPNNYGDKLMYLDYAYVKQIREEDISSSQAITWLNLVGADVQYNVYYIGKLDDVFEDDGVEVYGIPLGRSSFENTEGGTTLVIVLGACKVEKVEDSLSWLLQKQAPKNAYTLHEHRGVGVW